jgi:branched-chain amino acid transport system ATP-binding protein
MSERSGEREILEVQDVSHAYGGAWAVRGCSFTVAEATVTGLIGPNGAGKSTLIEVLSGFLQPATGRIVFQGDDITKLGPADRARRGIARTFQIPRLLSRLTVLENIMIAAGGQVGEGPLAAVLMRWRWRAQERELRAEAAGLAEWLGLSRLLSAEARTLSGGQQRLLEIARALMARPKLLLLDEPTAGVFPELSHLIADRVIEIARQGVTVLLIAHNMGFLGRVTDDVIVMAEGKVLTRGSLDEVRAHHEVVSAYLGLPKSIATGVSEEEVPS